MEIVLGFCVWVIKDKLNMTDMKNKKIKNDWVMIELDESSNSKDKERGTDLEVLLKEAADYINSEFTLGEKYEYGTFVGIYGILARFMTGQEEPNGDKVWKSVHILDKEELDGLLKKK